MGSVPWAGGVRDDKWQQSRAEKTWAAGAAAARGTHAAQEEVVQHVVEVTQSETVVSQAHRRANAAGHAPCSSIGQAPFFVGVLQPCCSPSFGADLD